jgi:hypothetical protein
MPPIAQPHADAEGLIANRGTFAAAPGIARTVQPSLPAIDPTSFALL